MASNPSAIETTDDGTPVIAGSAVPVQTLLEHFQAGGTLPEFLQAYPDVDSDTAVQVMELALEAIDQPQTEQADDTDAQS